MLKKLTRMAIAALLVAASAALIPAQAATPDDAKAMAEKAAALVAKDGDKAFSQISDPNGAFHDALEEAHVDVPILFVGDLTSGHLAKGMVRGDDGDGEGRADRSGQARGASSGFV